MKIKISILAATLALVSTTFSIEPPRVVGVPPADAGRGLVRVGPSEIRHYPGKGGTQMLVSTDNGETWAMRNLPDSYPGATCLSKESPSLAMNPNTEEYITIEPLYRKKEASEGIYISKGGIDGEWNRVVDKQGNPVIIGGILRSPLWVKDNKRILVPGHGGGCWTWYSDDQGLTWERSNKVNAPAHKAEGIHKGIRWNHGMVEGTLVELENGDIWMVARTAQDQHYETFSNDYGRTWEDAKPSRFYGTITMPTFSRMKDGRLLFLWSNTASLPELERATGRGEDVFTNRDTIHAAISEDDGKTWIGFRELVLDDHRGDSDYATAGGAQDRGKHQAEVVQLDDDRVLFSCGQHPRHRKLMIMDVRWLYEPERKSELAKDNADWSTQQFIAGIKGHCAYNRTPGAVVETGALRVRCMDDDSLASPNQGAVWNFPAGHTGEFKTSIRLEKGGAGMQISLCDRWFNPTDPAVAGQSIYTLAIDGEGRLPNGRTILEPGKKHELQFSWRNCDTGGKCTLTIDGKRVQSKLAPGNECPNGISYVHFYNPARKTDLNGFSIFTTHFLR
jgi:hypothetical protein